MMTAFSCSEESSEESGGGCEACDEGEAKAEECEDEGDASADDGGEWRRGGEGDTIGCGGIEEVGEDHGGEECIGHVLEECDEEAVAERASEDGEGKDAQ